MIESTQGYVKLIHTLNKIGVALSAEQDNSHLLRMILSGAMEITNADGGTLYLVHKNQKLSIAIIANKTLQIKPSNIFETELSITSIPLYIKGKPNLKNAASYCYHKKKLMNIADAYQNNKFDLSGTRTADKENNYHSKSLLVIPLKDHENNTIGVLQLINAIDEKSGEIISFDKQHVLLAESLASQAAIILTKQQLIQSQRKLFESLLHLIANSIDEKSKHTSNHCTRVPILTLMIANAINAVDKGPLKNKHLSKDELDELMVSSWLHDCGKIVTPDYIMNKATKLEIFSDKIEVINERFEILKRDAKILYLEKLTTDNKKEKDILEREYNARLQYLDEAKNYLNLANTGGEFLSVEDQNKIRSIGEDNSYSYENQKKPLLSEQEITNLSISRGTLNDEERQIIQNHVKITQTMLASLPYPSNLKNVPEIAGSHHERLDGTGYPNGKTKDQLSLQARILAIADIFEALTSSDRPYKTPKTLKEVVTLMDKMKNAGHIDPDVYDLFIRSEIYLNYAKKYLKPEQIDV